MEKVMIKANDGYEIDGLIFEASSPKAVIQVMHGMEEHKERYIELAEHLTKKGFNVLLTDMRGHGQTATDLGYFAEKNGYLKLIQDQIDIKDYLKDKYTKLPLYIFAHSMGTITARVLLQKHSKDYSKVALSGYPNYQGAAGAGKAICNIIQAFKGSHYKSNLVKGMAFGAFAKAIPNRKTDFDWLSYNDKNVADYIADPLDGFGFTVSAYRDLFSLVQKLKMNQPYENVNEIPFLLISGEEDPCTGGEKGRNYSLETLKHAGFKDITVKVYPKMRHEILNEDKKNEVFEDISSFFLN